MQVCGVRVLRIRLVIIGYGLQMFGVHQHNLLLFLAIMLAIGYPQVQQVLIILELAAYGAGTMLSAGRHYKEDTAMAMPKEMLSSPAERFLGKRTLKPFSVRRF